MKWNLVGSIYGRSSINIAYFVLIREQTWPSQAILVFDWLISKKKSSPLKPLGQMNRNLIGSILGKSFIKIGNLDNYVNMKMTLNTYCQSFPNTIKLLHFNLCYIYFSDSIYNTRYFYSWYYYVQSYKLCCFCRSPGHKF